MLKLAWILCSLSALTAATPIYPEFVSSPDSQYSEEDILYPFDTLDEWQPRPEQQLRNRVKDSTAFPAASASIDHLLVAEETPVYIAPRDPGFKTAYASLNPLEYAADLQEEEEERKRKGQQVGTAAEGYGDWGVWRGTLGTGS